MSQIVSAVTSASSIAAADRRVEEEVARFLKPRQRAKLANAALDVGVTGLPIVGVRAEFLQHGVGQEQAGRFDVDHEARIRMARGEVAREDHADLVGEDLVAFIVDDAAAIAIAVEAETDVRACSPSPSRQARGASSSLRGWDCSAGK